MLAKIEIEQEIAERLNALAKAKGMSVDEYLRKVIEADEDAVNPGARSSLEEFERDMDALAEGLEDLPVLPDEAFSRASFYEDHD